MKKPLVLGNWKMNGSTTANAQWLQSLTKRLASARSLEVAIGICPPFPYLYTIARELPPGVRLGAQDVSCEENGARTGEVSAAMLEDLDCRYVIVGHSERRIGLCESDADVVAKFGRVKDAGLTPVLCVGENLQQKESGVAEDVVGRQLQVIADAFGAAAFKDSVIAYEPVWAIGSGQSASLHDIRNMHGHIDAWLQERGIERGECALIYGGSIKADNCAPILGLAAVDGVLVGGASLDASSFWAICRAAQAAALKEKDLKQPSGRRLSDRLALLQPCRSQGG